MINPYNFEYSPTPQTLDFFDDLYKKYPLFHLDQTLNPDSPAYLRKFNHIQVGEACYLLNFLKNLPDEVQNFPCGKWATIQYLESLIDEHFKNLIACVGAKEP